MQASVQGVDDRPSVLIEAFGLPAVGKSFVTDALCRCLVAREVEFSNSLGTYNRKLRLLRIPVKTLHAALIAVSFPRLSSQIAGLVMRRSAGGILRKLAVIINYLFLLGVIWRRRADGGVVVLDQGIAQATWACLPASEFHAAARDWEALLLRLLKELGINSWLVIDVCADPAVHAARAAGRRVRTGMRPVKKGDAKWLETIRHLLQGPIAHQFAGLDIEFLDTSTMDAADLNAWSERMVRQLTEGDK